MSRFDFHAGWDRCFMSLECVIVWWASTLCSFSLEIARKIW